MKTDIQIFNNPQFGNIRIVMNESGEPMFCLADVCNILSLQTNKVKERLKYDGWNSIPCTDNLGRTQQVTFINEQNFYKSILQSRKEEAESFSDWVTGEVLPSIRKHGAYMTPQKIEEALLNPDILIQLATNLKEEQQKRIQAEGQIEAQKPKVLFADAIIASDTSILIGRLANVLKQNGVDIGQNRLFKWMRDNGYLCKFGERYNQPTQYSMDLGLFEVSYNTVVRPEKSFQTITTKVTGKGQVYFVDKFLTSKSA